MPLLTRLFPSYLTSWPHPGAQGTGLPTQPRQPPTWYPGPEKQRQALRQPQPGLWALPQGRQEGSTAPQGKGLPPNPPPPQRAGFSHAGGSHLPRQGKRCLSRTSSARCKPAASPGPPPPPAPSCRAPAARTRPPPPPAGSGRRNGGQAGRGHEPGPRPGGPAAPRTPTCSSVASHSSHWLVRSVGSCPPARKKYLREGRAGQGQSSGPARRPAAPLQPRTPPVLTGRWRWGRRARRRCPAAGRAPTGSTAATGAALRDGRARQGGGGGGTARPPGAAGPPPRCRGLPPPPQRRPHLPGRSSRAAPGRRRTERPPPPSAPRGRPPPPAAASPLMQPGRAASNGFRRGASGSRGTTTPTMLRAGASRRNGASRPRGTTTPIMPRDETPKLSREPPPRGGGGAGRPALPW